MLTTITTAPKMTASSAGKFGVLLVVSTIPQKYPRELKLARPRSSPGAGGCSLNGGLEGTVLRMWKQ